MIELWSAEELSPRTFGTFSREFSLIQAARSRERAATLIPDAGLRIYSCDVRSPVLPASPPDARARGPVVGTAISTQPCCRTRRYQVEGEAQTLPSRCARTASVPVGTCRY